MQITVTGYDLTADLKGKTKSFEFPPMPITVSVDVPVADKKVEPLLKQKLQDAAGKKLDDITKLFTSEMLKIDARITAALAKDPNSVNLKNEQNTADTMSKQIAQTLPAHVSQACAAAYAELGKAHKELLKYQLKCAAKIAWSSVKISVAAVRLGASHGADVKSWMTVGKEIQAIATVVVELAKSADTVQKEVAQEYGKLILAVAKVKKETNGIKIAARQLVDVEPKCKKVDEKLAVLRPKVTGIDEKSHGLSKGLDKLLNDAEVKGKELNPKAQAKVAEMEKQIDGLITRIVTMQTEVEAMRAYADAVTMTVAQFRADYTKGVPTAAKVMGLASACKPLLTSAGELVKNLSSVVSAA